MYDIEQTLGLDDYEEVITALKGMEIDQDDEFEEGQRDDASRIAYAMRVVSDSAPEASTDSDPIRVVLDDQAWEIVVEACLYREDYDPQFALRGLSGRLSPET